MIDIIVLLGLVLGAFLLFINKKWLRLKQLYVVGLVVIIVSVALGLPDFISGFVEGYNAGNRFGT